MIPNVIFALGEDASDLRAHGVFSHTDGISDLPCRMSACRAPAGVYGVLKFRT
jgi:hypothetical protein